MHIELKKIASVFNGKTPSKDEQRESGFPVLKIKDIDDRGFFKGKFDSFIDHQLAERLKRKYTKVGDTLILNAAHNSDYVGTKKCFVSENFSDVLATGEWAVVRPDIEKVIPRYLFFILNSPGFQFSLQNVVKGIHLYPKDLERIKVYCPSLEDQKRIVKILDQADALRPKRKQAIDLLDDYLRSMFLKMFGDPVNNHKRWEKQKFEKLGKLDRGISKHRPRNAPELLGGSHPLIQTGDVANCGTYIEKFNSTYSDIGLMQSKKWPKGTLCITIAANIAKTGILGFDACFPDSVVGFLADTSRTNNKFIHFWMSFFQEILERNAPESAQKNINLRILRDLDIIAPPIELQNKFAEIVATIETLKKNMLAQSKEMENHFQTLMQKAFNGAL